MKDEILKISKRLEKGILTEKEAQQELCILFGFSGSFYIHNHIATNAEFGCIAETQELALSRLVNELGYKKEEFAYKTSHILI